MLKYIITHEIDDKDEEHEVCYMFPPSIEHINFATKRRFVVLSAGFVVPYSRNKLEPYGKSHTLQIGSRPCDVAILNSQFTEDDFIKISKMTEEEVYEYYNIEI